MALVSNNTALALVIQSAEDSFTAPSASDIMPISSLRPQIDGVTIDNDEYTGSPFRNAPDVVGKRFTASFNVKLRPPGGADVPAANAYLPGRILQAAKFTELRTTTAIPAAPEALGAGSTTTAAKLGATAAATAGLYKGMPLILSDNGSTYKQRLTAIRGYDASKTATLPETLGAAPAANWQIPKNLAYFRSITSDDPVLLSLRYWLDGHRFDLINGRVSGLQIVVPTATKNQPAYPEIQVTIDATIYAHADEATPAVTALGAVPLYRDGDCWLANKAIGTQTFTVDLGLSVENPPNPNKADGVDAAVLTGGTARVTMTRQKYLKSEFDTLTLAEAQGYHAFWAQWGNGTAGGMTQILVPDHRFNFPSHDLGGAIIMESGDLMIDAIDRSVCITFPY